MYSDNISFVNKDFKIHYTEKSYKENKKEDNLEGYCIT